MRFKLLKQMRIFQQRDLHNFTEAAKPMFDWQRRKKMLVAQNGPRRREATQSIFLFEHVHSAFHAHGGIILSKRGGWNANHAHAAVGNCSAKTNGVKHGAATVQAMVVELEGRLDLEELVLRDATTLELNDIGRVRLRLASPLPVDPYDRLRRTGAFLVVDPATGNTLAAGLVRDA